MDTIQLRYLITVAQLHSFTATAARFKVTQPTVCRQISALEEELGLRLLKRSTHGVSLTAAGQECLEYAHRILDLEDRALSRVVNIAEGRSGTVRAAVLPSSASALGRCLSTFSQRYPDIQVDVDMLSAFYTFTDEELHSYDFFFTLEPVLSDHSLLDFRDTGREQFHLLAHQADAVLVRGQDFSPLARRPFLTINRDNEPLLLAQAMSVCRNRGFAPRLSGNYNHVYAVLIAVNAGVGVTILPRSFLDHTCFEHLAALPIEGEDASVSSVIAWHKNSDNLAVSRFLEVVDELYPP